MNKTSKSIIAAGVLTVVTAAWGLFPSMGNAASLQDVEKTWGKPAAVISTGSGEKRYYKYQNTMDMGYRVFNVQGSEVVDAGTTGYIPKVNAPQKPGLPANAMSKDYWANHPTTAEALGTPTSIRHLPDGSVEMFYKYQGAADIGNRYYIVKDGKVVASGTTSRPMADPQKETVVAPRAVSASANYYQNNQMTLQTIEATWGKPVEVKTLDNGTEKRFYKYSNTQTMGYRYFVIKDGKVIESGTEG
jgi:hypothetical protein